MVEKLDIHQTYSEINEAIEKEDHQRILNLSEKILKADPKEKEAFQCRMISLVNLGENDQIISIIEKSNLQKEYLLEYAYALHEKKRFDDSTKVLKENETNRPDLKNRIEEFHKNKLKSI